MVKIVTIIGARPQFIKAAPLSEVIRSTSSLCEVIIHTGQHYDVSMSEIFFNELGIPAPDYNLNVGSGTHGAQTGEMIKRIEEVLLKENPNYVLVYGDTNSTLAGAIAAVKIHIPLLHVEAGVRSFNTHMPEEINRLVTDRISTFLFCPSQTAADNLFSEGIKTGVHVVGDVMLDALSRAVHRSTYHSNVLSRLKLENKQYSLVTIHRAENTDNDIRMKGILRGLAGINHKIVFPVHPRTKNRLNRYGNLIRQIKNIDIIDPVGYLDMVKLEQSARFILTDSGGIQKEAYWLKVPCITFRDETEWVETVSLGWNYLAGAESTKIISLANNLSTPTEYSNIYGAPGACDLIIKALLEESV